MCKMASESSREETLLLLRQTISRYNRLKEERLWSGNDAAIEDAFRDIRNQRLVVLHKKPFIWHSTALIFVAVLFSNFDFARVHISEVALI